MSFEIRRIPSRVVEQVDLVFGPVTVSVTENVDVNGPLKLTISKPDFYTDYQEVPLDIIAAAGAALSDYAKAVLNNRAAIAPPAPPTDPTTPTNPPTATTTTSTTPVSR